MKIQKIECITETDKNIRTIEFKSNGLMYIYWKDGKQTVYDYKLR